MDSASHDITDLLSRWREGDSAAENALIERVYPVLKQLAQQRLSRNEPVSLAVTDLAHEAYFSLIRERSMGFANRSHFFAIAAIVIRRVLVDHMREQAAQKRGGGVVHLTLDGAADIAAPATPDLLDIERLLLQLEQAHPRAARVVELRFFTGLSIEETAEVTRTSLATAKRDWHFARAWLHDQLADSGKSSSACA